LKLNQTIKRPIENTLFDVFDRFNIKINIRFAALHNYVIFDVKHIDDIDLYIIMFEFKWK